MHIEIQNIKNNPSVGLQLSLFCYVFTSSYSAHFVISNLSNGIVVTPPADDLPEMTLTGLMTSVIYYPEFIINKP